MQKGVSGYFSIGCHDCEVCNPRSGIIHGVNHRLDLIGSSGQEAIQSAVLAPYLIEAFNSLDQRTFYSRYGRYRSTVDNHEINQFKANLGKVDTVILAFVTPQELENPKPSLAGWGEISKRANIAEVAWLVLPQYQNHHLGSLIGRSLVDCCSYHSSLPNEDTINTVLVDLADTGGAKSRQIACGIAHYLGVTSHGVKVVEVPLPGSLSRQSPRSEAFLPLNN